MWPSQTCPVCAAVIGDEDAHREWHGTGAAEWAALKASFDAAQRVRLREAMVTAQAWLDGQRQARAKMSEPCLSCGDSTYLPAPERCLRKVNHVRA